MKTGKLDVASLVTSIIADFAKLAARKFLFAPLSAALSGVLGGGLAVFSAAPRGRAVAATVIHAGGLAGAGPLRISTRPRSSPRRGSTPARLRGSAPTSTRRSFSAASGC